jgi:hypothetical protein
MGLVPITRADWRDEAEEAYRALEAARDRGDELAAITAEQRLNRALEKGHRDLPQQRHDG